MLHSQNAPVVTSLIKPGSHMSPMIGESLSVIIQGENSQRILLMSNHRQWLSPMSATYENHALHLAWNGLKQQADIRMRSHALRQLVDDKSVASCQQTCCKLIVKTCYPQACCKLLQQVVTSVQMTSCNKPDFNRLVAN